MTMAENATVFDFDASSIGGGGGELSSTRIDELLKSVLKKRWPGVGARHQIKKCNERLLMCCPYCGDSVNTSKKRGNFYPEWLFFKCYNGGCGVYVDLNTLLENFDCGDLLTASEGAEVRIAVAGAKEHRHKIDSTEATFELFTGEMLGEILIPREKLMTDLGLWEIRRGSPQWVYLEKRCQVPDNKFAWDNRARRLFVFNLDATGDWVFSAQARSMESGGAKYLTYHISDLWKMLGEQGKAELSAKYDTTSALFGLLKLDFVKVVTIFEGPLDSFLFPNSAATCSVNNGWPFDTLRRWFVDNDEAGRNRALDLIRQRESVFLWGRFLREHGLRTEKVKDLNDIKVIEASRNVSYGDLSRYFSTGDPLEMIDIEGAPLFGVNKNQKKKPWKKRM